MRKQPKEPIYYAGCLVDVFEYSKSSTWKPGAVVVTEKHGIKFIPHRHRFFVWRWLDHLEQLCFNGG